MTRAGRSNEGRSGKEEYWGMSETTAVASPIQEKILALAQEGDIQAIEEAWIELTSAPPEDADFYKKVLKAFQSEGKLDAALQLFLLVMEPLQQRGDWKMLDRILAVAAPKWPQSRELRDYAQATYRGRYAKLAVLEDVLVASGIKGEAPLDQGIKKFREFLRVAPGQAYSHVSWGEGIVKALDARAGKVTIDFPKEKGKVMTLEGVKSYLTFLNPTGFLARRTKNPEQLREMAEENPVDLVRLVLESSCGKIKQSDLKALLIGTVVPDSKWTTWWGKARTELRLDPMIDLDASGGARAQIALREKPRSVAEEIDDLFFSAGADFASRVAAVQLLSQPAGASALSHALLKRMIEHLEKEFRQGGGDDAVKTLGIAFLIEDLKSLDAALKHHISPIPHPDALLKSVHDYATLLDLEHIDHAVRALHHLLARDGTDGTARAAGLIPNAPVKLAQAIWKEFDFDHHRAIAIEALEKLLQRPFDNPETYLWAIKMLLEEQHGDLEGRFALPDIVMDLLGKLEDWAYIASDSTSGRAVIVAAQQLVARTRTMLGARNYAAICTAAENMTLDQAQRLRQTIQKSDALNSTFKSGAARQLVLTRKDLDLGAAAEARRPAEADVHFCTAKARRQKMAEMRELQNVKIPANSRAIEEARQEGDLRENAGYHAAKDEQKIMMQQVLALQEALASTRVMRADMVRDETIMFGTRFTAENKNTGATETYTLLGKWEADAANNIISIQAPFAQQFLGKTAGDEFEVTLPVGGSVPYRVISVENALASGEWDDEGADEAAAETEV